MKAQLRRLIRRLVPHRRSYYWDRGFRRLSPETLGASLRTLGVHSSSIVLVHSSFSALGHFTSGPAGFIHMLLDLVGPDGTVVMPAFATDESMESYVSSDPIFDILKSPSRSGVLTEVFRTWPGVVRSLHPTHSVCAIGRHARELTEGHERSSTPCGPDSPFGRLVALGGTVLRIGTGAMTLYHHVQELVDFPHLFLPETVRLRCIDEHARTTSVSTRVYRQRVPHILFLGDDSEGQLWAVHPSNFPLLHPGRREAMLCSDHRYQAVLSLLLDIRKDFESRGWSMQGMVNGCFIDMCSARHYVEYAVAEERKLLDRYRRKYKLPDLLNRLHDGLYPPRE